MGAYLDRLNEQFDEIREGIDALVNRAADENRDVSDTEQVQVDRDRGRLTELQTAIEHYTAIESQGAKVADLRRSVPATVQTTRTKVTEPEYDINREFPTIGDYAITVHRATALKDPEAIEALQRATAHQLLADNPGLVPKPVLGPVVNLLETSRPFISSITTRPLPAGKFDRPVITQHVAVGVQAAEKTLTESRKMTVGSLPVTASTFAGHLNISRQDIKWTSPSILNIVFDDFAAMYAQATCDWASGAFEASVTNVQPIAEASGPGITEAFYTAAATALAASGAGPDTLWVAPDVWGRLGGMSTSQDVPSFPSLSLTGTGGNPLGLKLVVDEHFTPGTMIIGPSKYAEWYEDVDGLMQVGEPDVLGQLVGYAGFGAFLNVNPPSFTGFTLPAPVAAGAQSSGSDSGSKASK